MDNVDHQNLLSSLLEKNPKEVRALIQDIFSEAKEELKNVNGHGLAEVLASKAQESLRSNEEGLAFEWGEILEGNHEIGGTQHHTISHHITSEITNWN